jgi:uncharacterized membrane protein YdjX (TVP38/TMEM64 family)
MWPGGAQRKDPSWFGMAEARSRSWLMWLAPAVVVCGLVGAYVVWPAYREVVAEGWAVLSSRDQGRVEAWARGYGLWGPLLIVGAMIAQVIVMVIPSTFMELAAVLAYGPWWGGLLAWASALIAAAVAYGIGRLLGPATVDRMLGGRNRDKVERYVDRYGLWAVMLARFSPILSIDAVSVVAGLGRMGFGRFLLATGAGMAPFVVLLGVLGSDFARLETGLIVVSIASLVAFAAYVIWDHRRPGHAAGSRAGG